MRLTESIYSKNMKIRTEDPYMLSLDIMKRISGFAKVIEKRNNYMTDGPHHVSEVIFEAVQDIDEHTKIRLIVEMHGSGNELSISVEGAILVNITKYGFVSDVFSEYYIRNIYPEIKKDAETKYNNLARSVEKVLHTV